MTKYFTIFFVGFVTCIHASSQNTDRDKEHVLQSLFSAVRNNNIKEAKLLLDKGADPNAYDADSDNVLMNAAIYASVNCMKLLLENGADPNTKNMFGETPLMLCAHDEPKVKLLLENSADINAKAKSGNTALMIAVVGNGRYDITKMMLDKGADPVVKNVNLETTLTRAALFGDTATISLLLNQGIDINAQDEIGETALFNAVINSNKLTALKLLESGADPDLAIRFGLNALSIAALNGDIDVVNAALKKTRDVNAVHTDGHTALMWAAYNEHDNIQVIQALLDMGADPNIKCADGSTALSWALKKGNTATVALLKKGVARVKEQ